MKRIKVVALVEAYVVTGPAKNILRFAADCRDRVDLTVVTFVREQESQLTQSSTNEFIAATRGLGIPVEIVRESRRFDLSVLDKLGRIFRDRRPDIVQTHGTKSHFLLSLLPRKAFQWVAFHHGYTSEDLKTRFYCQFDRWSLPCSDFVVTVCAEFAKTLTSRGVSQDRVVVVPNSIKSDSSAAVKSDATRLALGISPDDKVILAVGRLSPEKGHRHLIDAVARIVSLAPQSKIRVLIAGAGLCELKLREQISKLGLAQRVAILGYRPDVRALFSVADLFVLPSLSEGSPNVLLESMAAGVPIVASNVGGIPELVTHAESALLVLPADTEALARAIDALLREGTQAQQLANVALERVRLMFSPEKYDERILSIYDHLLQNKAGAPHICVA